MQPDSQSNQRPLSQNWNLIFWGFVLIPTLLALFAVSVYVFHFGTDLASDQSIWGQFGDYLGGIINPFVGLFTIGLLVLTLKLQREELREQKTTMQQQYVEAQRSANALASQYQAIKIQSFEQSLFAWLANYRNLLMSITTGRNNSLIDGRNALLRLYEQRFSGRISCLKYERNELGEWVGEQDNENYVGYIQLNLDAVAGDGSAKALLTQRFQRAVTNYRLAFEENRPDLDALFRTLYRLLKWIDKSDLDNSKKWHYVALVRAQLSWIELIYLAYNGLMPEGAKFVALINRYALLDNIAPEADGLIQAFANVFPVCRMDLRGRNFGGDQWPYFASAFSSDVAKKELGIPLST